MFEDTPHDQSLADPLPDEPFGLLLRWMIEAQSSGALNPDAMVVGTLDEHGYPRARTVLCRGVDTARGALMFYTNRDSAKGRQLAEPRAGERDVLLGSVRSPDVAARSRRTSYRC